MAYNMRGVALLIVFLLQKVAIADSNPPVAPQDLRLVTQSDNQAPLAVDTTYRSYQARSLNVTAPGVLTNDSDPDGDTLTARLVSEPGNGELTLNSDGSFSYTPTTAFLGVDSFSYNANDGALNSNVATVTITVVPASAEPWFEDSFEEEAPGGWNSTWSGEWSPFHAHDTTNQWGTPPGGDRYAYRQWFPDTTELLPVMADHTSNTYTSNNHGYIRDMPVRLYTLAGEGGVIPTGVEMHTSTYSYIYYIVNPTLHTFQLRRYNAVSNFSDNGQSPFYVQEQRPMGGLGLRNWGTAQSPIPLISEGDDISISYWLKYHPDFDFGSATGNKHWMMASSDNPTADRVYQIIQWNPPGVRIYFQTTTDTGPLAANIGGPFNMPAGEWVKFDWYIKVSPDTDNGRKGILKGWINNQLRWHYENIATIQSGSYQSIVFWAQHGNAVPRGQNQERYWDLIRIGPGSMVLYEQQSNEQLSKN